MSSNSPSPDEIAYELELLPFRIYKSGRVERYAAEDVNPPSEDSPHPLTGVYSKDVVIDPSTGVSARLYLPPLSDPKEKLPVLVYYHGGGFVVASPFTPLYDSYVSALVAKGKVLAVSVHHRRAPEHPLPAAYEDSWGALRWVASHATGAGPDAWLNSHGDFGRVFLAGDSSGANISHNLAMRVGKESLPHDVAIEGIVLVHPYFWSKERLPEEAKVEPGFLGRMDGFWPVVYPDSELGYEDPRVDPMTKRAPSMKGLACRRVLVMVAGKDVLVERGWRYYEELRRCGWGGKAEIWESKGEPHVFHLFNPFCDAAAEKMGRVVSFFNGV